MSSRQNEEINLDVLPKEPERTFSELEQGRMVIARNKDDFLYILESDGTYHMFSHTAGAAGGGQRQFPKNEKYTAAVRKIVDLSDSLYAAEYNREMNIYGVMATTEDAVLSMFPGAERENDAVVEFKPWDREKSARESDGSYGESIGDDPFGPFNPIIE